jgi:hypothetical protein
MQVDADESIEADDAAALRAFLEHEALPGIVYGFRHVRAWGDDLADPLLGSGDLRWHPRHGHLRPGRDVHRGHRRRREQRDHDC